MAFTHYHTQTPASATWVITHGLGFKPIVDISVVIGGVSQKIEPVSIVHDSTSQVTITFSTAYTGTARLA